MTMHLGEAAMLAVAVRVLGRDAVVLLRRLAAAGVRAGVNEMNRRQDGGAGR
ncbi:hypothetical protein ACIQVO_36925 [Streptomyces sp. NPDC101062]|uniref:hypothetical protein n=1 Tax=unclassified Streptomyces TaxID=2593676 RepID=UPI0037F8E2C7